MDWIYLQLQFQGFGLLAQLIALWYDFDKNHKKEMDENKYHGEASFSQMFVRYLGGRKYETYKTFVYVLIGTLTLHIPIVYQNLTQLLPSFPYASPDIIIIVLIGLFVFMGKALFLKKVNAVKRQKFSRRNK